MASYYAVAGLIGILALTTVVFGGSTPHHDQAHHDHAVGSHHTITECFDRPASISMSCLGTSPAGILHLYKVAYDHRAKSQDCHAVGNLSSCHSIETLSDTFARCELKDSCHATLEPTQLHCGSMANFGLAEYRCLHGPRERLSCVYGSACSAASNWKLDPKHLTDGQWVWHEPGEEIIDGDEDDSSWPYSYYYYYYYSENWFSPPPRVPFENGSWPFGPGAASRGRRSASPPAGISSYITSDLHVAYVVSPDYPHNYAATLEGSCHIQTLEGAMLHMHVLRFELEHNEECSFDWLKVSTEGVTHKLCGTLPQGAGRDLGYPAATLNFHADSSVHDAGFLLSFTAVTPSGENVPVGVWCGPLGSLEWYFKWMSPELLMRDALEEIGVDMQPLVDIKGGDSMNELFSRSYMVVIPAFVTIILLLLLIVLAVVICRRTGRQAPPIHSQPSGGGHVVYPNASIPVHSVETELGATAGALPEKSPYDNSGVVRNGGMSPPAYDAVGAIQPITGSRKKSDTVPLTGNRVSQLSNVYENP